MEEDEVNEILREDFYNVLSEVEDSIQEWKNDP